MTLVVRGRVLRALLALPLLAVPASAHASGFAIESQGARAMGFAGAYVAQAADPSAIFYNAAGIGFLKGKQLYVRRRLRGGSRPTSPAAGPTRPRARSRSRAAAWASCPRSTTRSRWARRRSIGAGREPAVRRQVAVGQPRHVHRPLHLPRLRDRVVVDQPHDRVQARRPPRDRRRGSTCASRTSASRAASSASPNPFPVPTDVAELTLDSGTTTGVGFNVGLLASPTENLSIGALLPSQGDDRPRRAGELRADPHRQHSRWTTRWRSALPASQPATVSFTYPGQHRGGRRPAPRLLDGRGRLPVDAVVELRRGDDRLRQRARLRHGPAPGLGEHLAGGARRRVPDRRRLGGARRLRLRPQPGAHGDDLAVHPRRRPLHVRGRAAAGSTRTSGSTSTCGTWPSARARRSASAATTTTGATSTGGLQARRVARLPLLASRRGSRRPSPWTAGAPRGRYIDARRPEENRMPQAPIPRRSPPSLALAVAVPLRRARPGPGRAALPQPRPAGREAGRRPPRPADARREGLAHDRARGARRAARRSRGSRGGTRRCTASRGPGGPRSSRRRSRLAATWDTDLMLRVATGDLGRGPRHEQRVGGARQAQPLPGPRLLVAQHQHLPRPALGPRAGDLRRGPVPHRRASAPRS